MPLPAHLTDRDGKRRGTVGWDTCTSPSTTYGRLAYAEVLAGETATAAAFRRRALAPYARYGIRVQRVLTDNGSAQRGAVHALACCALGVRHLRTRPRRPQTNGKAERFIRTLLAGWAYGASMARRRRAARLARRSAETPDDH